MAKAKKKTVQKKSEDFKDQTAEIAQSPEPVETEVVSETEEVVLSKKTSKKSKKGNPLVDTVKSIRIDLDGMMQCAKLAYGDKSDVVVNLFYGKAWLGKYLGALGAQNPYITNTPPKHKGEIPKTADVYDDALALRNFQNLGMIEKALYLRAKLIGIISQIESMDGLGGREGAIARTNAYNKLSEARFDLGNVLAQIRES